MPDHPGRRLSVAAHKAVLRGPWDPGERLVLGSVVTVLGSQWAVVALDDEGPVYEELPATLGIDLSCRVRHVGLRGLDVGLAVHDLLDVARPSVQVARPLGSLTEVARRFGQEGEAHLELPLSQGDFRVDEVRVLSQTFAAMVQRITAQMAELELEKRRAVDTEQLAVRASASKSAFLGNMSHELRTPLNVIIGYCELIDEAADDTSPQEIRADLGRAISSARHLLALINDVLDLSKVEAERLDVATEAYDAVAVLEAAVAEARPLVERNGNQLVLNVPVRTTPMLGDVTRVHQCLLNLWALERP